MKDLNNISKFCENISSYYLNEKIWTFKYNSIPEMKEFFDGTHLLIMFFFFNQKVTNFCN